MPNLTAPLAARRIAASLAAGIVLLASAVPVLAHAELGTATPGPDEVVVGSPPELVATFTEPLDPGRSSIVVVAADGATLAEGGAAETSADGLTMTVPLPPLDPGGYEVRWTAVATDGHVERGTYTFTVEAPPSPSPSPSPSPGPSASPPPSPEPSPSPSPEPRPEPNQTASDVDPLASALPILIVAIAVGILAVWWTRRRAS